MKNISINLNLYVHYIYICILLVLATTSINATILTTRNGLSSSLVNKIFQSSDGLIWIATEDGLNKYDGAKCQIYRNIANDSTSLIDSYTLTVYESSDKQIFVGTQHGVALYNREKDLFERIHLTTTNSKVEVFAYVPSIVEVNEDIIYIGTSGHGIFEYNKKTKASRQININVGFYITTLFKDSQNNIWISSNDKGISRLSNNGFVYSVKAEADNMSTFCEDQDHNIYGACLKDGLFKHNEETESFEKIAKGSPSVHAKTITYYNGKILVGTDGGGIFSYEPKDDKLKRFNVSSLPFDGNKIKVHSIVIDQSNNIWIALFQKGVVVIPTNNNDFRYVGYKSAINNLIGSNYISSVLCSKDSTLYVGTDNDGLYVINQKTNKTLHFGSTTEGPSTILCICEDKDGNIWLGTYLEGIYIFNPRNQTCKKIDQVYNLKFPTESINDIVTDGKRFIWIGSMGGGLTVFDTQKNKTWKSDVKNGFAYRENKNMLHNRWIECLYYSANHNKLFIGSLDGLGCFEVNTQSYVSTFGKNRVMTQCRIYDITEDKNGDIWIASNLGLTKLNSSTNEMKTYNNLNGIKIENIKAIESDHAGKIWASCGQGIICIDVDKIYAECYYEQDGIVCDEFSKKAGCISKDGRIFFGATDGLTYFAPDKIKQSYDHTNVKVADFYINGKRVLASSLSDGMQIISQNPKDSTLVYDLCRTDNTFTVEFTTTQLFPYQSISYIYTVQKDNEKPERAEETGPGINLVTFRDMKPGTYKITVIANNNGQLSDPYTLMVNVHQEIYATAFAKTLYFIICFIIAGLIFRQYKLRQQTKLQLAKTMHNQQVHAAKMEMFTNIAHEIRTPMSLVIAPLKELMSTDTDPRHKANYEVIQRNIQRILRLMAQVLDVQKIDAGKMKLHFCPTNVSKTVEDVCLTFGFEARSKNIKLTCDTTATTDTHVYVDHQYFDQAVTNIVSNAVKYTPEGGEITVKSTIEDNKYRLIVEDSGPGFSEDDLKHVFERFHRISFSAVGFGIGLDLTNTIIKLHNGSLIASNRTDGKQGGRMEILLQLGHTHLKDEDIEEPTQEQLAAESSLVTTEPDEAKRPKTQFRIVIADDDPEIRSYISSHLSETYTVTTCSDGREALNEILQEVPDLVVTDVVMPNMDGFELCRKIKHNININHLPVVVLTARSADTDRIESYENGADAYVAKPFSIDELSATIKNLISQRQKIMANIVAQQQISENTKSINSPEVMTYNEKLLQKITNTVNEHISESSYSIEDLAKDVGLSRVHLHRKMKEMTNLTTRDFVRNIRLKYAAKLLVEGQYDIRMVSELTGFASPTYFATAFKVFYGQTPKEYMVQQLGEDFDFDSLQQG